MNRAKAQYLFYSGRKRRGAKWQAGRYEGRFALIRSGRTVWEQTKSFVLK
jgi:hypothetical protein